MGNGTGLGVGESRIHCKRKIAYCAFFPHRVLAALAAAFFRAAGVMVTKRLFPPTKPPLRPIAAI